MSACLIHISLEQIKQLNPSFSTGYVIGTTFLLEHLGQLSISLLISLIILLTSPEKKQDGGLHKSHPHPNNSLN